MQRLVGWSGVGVAALFGAGNALWAFEAPKPGASRSEIVHFYERASTRVIAGGSLSLLSIALFVFFAAGFRRLLSDMDRDELLGTTAFGGALVGATAGLGAETINMAGAMRAREGKLSGELAQSLFETSQVLGYNAAGLGVGTFGAATAATALRTDAILPRWLAALSGILGIALMTPLSRIVFGPAILVLGAIAARLLREPAPRG